MAEESLSIREAAAELAVNERSVRRWCDIGKLRCLRTPGGYYRIRRADLEAFRATLATSASSGPSPVLKNLQEQIKERELRIQDRKLARDERKLDAEDAKEEQAKRKAEAEERAQAQRDEQDRARRRAQQKWRAVAEGWAEDHIPEGVPPTLKVRYYQTVKRTLDACELLAGVPDQAMTTIEAAAEEIFGPWKQQQQADEQQRQAQARATWMEQQVNEAWTWFGSRFHLEGLTVLDAELRAALRLEISDTMRGLGPDSSWGALHQAREQAVNGVLAVAAHREKTEAATTSPAPAAVAPAAVAPAAQGSIERLLREIGPYMENLRSKGWLPGLEASDVADMAHRWESQARGYLEGVVRENERAWSEAELREKLRDWLDRRLGLEVG